VDQRNDLSFLKMPANWEHWPESWAFITTGGALWGELKALVSSGAQDHCFHEIKDRLIGWQKWCANEGFGHQWQFANHLVDIGQLSAKSRHITDEKLTRHSFESLSPWQWDAFCSFLSRPRNKISNTTFSITLLFENKNVGCLAILETELVGCGTGDIYVDPHYNGFVQIGDDFQHSAVTVWQLAINHAAEVQDEICALMSVDARFRLSPIQLCTCPDPLSGCLSGRSAEAAFGLTLIQSINSYFGRAESLLLDQTVAVSATLSGSGVLGRVTGLHHKMEAAHLKEMALVIVSKPDVTVAIQAMQAAQTRSRLPGTFTSTEIVGAKSILDVLSLLSERGREKESVRECEKRACAQLSVLGGWQKFTMETHYVPLPLLLHLPAEDLLQEDLIQPDSKIDERVIPIASLRLTEIRYWEEVIRGRHVKTINISIEEIFSEFSKISDQAKKGSVVMYRDSSFWGLQEAVRLLFFNI
jgi:hypothetical protein